MKTFHFISMIYLKDQLKPIRILEENEIRRSKKTFEGLNNLIFDIIENNSDFLIHFEQFFELNNISIIPNRIYFFLQDID